MAFLPDGSILVTERPDRLRGLPAPVCRKFARKAWAG
jgi:hypothetical protein